MTRSLNLLTYSLLSILLTFNGCAGCENLPALPKAYYQVKGIVENPLIYLNEHKRSKLILDIDPKSELASKVSYHIVKWQVGPQVAGKLLDENLMPITLESKLKSGENILFYEPLSTGEHKISVEILDQYQEERRELIFSPVVVHEKKVSSFYVKLQAASKKVFSYKKGKLELEFFSKLEEASKLTYTIKSIESDQGKLFLEATGEELKVDQKLTFGKQNLLFKPNNGEIGKATIKLIIENKQGEESEASTTIQLKPVSFSVNAWIKVPQEDDRKVAKGDFSILEILLSEIDQELVGETWKLVSWKSSDGVGRSLVDSNLAELTTFPLKATEKNKFYLRLPYLNVGNAPTLTLVVEGPGGVKETADVQLSFAERVVITSKVEELEENILKQEQESNSFLHTPLEKGDYKKFKLARKESQRQLEKFEQEANAIKNSYSASNGTLSAKTEAALRQIVNQKIPALKKKQTKLDALKGVWKKERFAFKTKLATEVKEIFSNQEAVVVLDITAKAKEAASLDYTVKTVEVSGGELLVENTREELKIGQKLTFGQQNFIFKPSQEKDKATIKITVKNNKGVESKASVSVAIKSIHFKVHAWAKEVKGKEASIMAGDFVLIEIAIADIDPRLHAEEWQLASWKFKKEDHFPEEGVAHLKQIAASLEQMHVAQLGSDKQQRRQAAIENKQRELTDKVATEEDKKELALLEKKYNDQKSLQEYQAKQNSLISSSEPVLVNSQAEIIASLSLKAVQRNKLYLQLPHLNIGNASSLLLTVIGPGKTEQEVEVPLAEVYKLLLNKKVGKVLALARKASKDLDNKLNIAPNGGSYIAIRESREETKEAFKESFNEIMAALGTEWWKNPTVLSLPVTEKIIGEISAFNKKENRLKALQQEAKERRTAFKINLEAPSRKLFIGGEGKILLDIYAATDALEAVRSVYNIKKLESDQGKLFLETTGEELKVGQKLTFGKHNLVFKPNEEQGSATIKLTVTNEQNSEQEASIALEVQPINFNVTATVVASNEEEKKAIKGDFAVLEIVLSDIDRTLSSEVWKLVSWQGGGNTVLGIVNKDLHSLENFPLNISGKNRLYVRINGFNTTTAPILKLKVEGPGKTTKEVEVSLAATYQNIISREIEQFLQATLSLNKEVESYFKLEVKQRKYDKLKLLIQASKENIDRFENTFKKIAEVNTLFASLSSSTKTKLHELIQTCIPNLRINKKMLDDEYEAWHQTIKGVFGVALLEEDIESYIQYIDKADKDGNYLIHMWAEKGTNNQQAGEFIIQRTLDINTKNNGGFTPLHLATRKMMRDELEKSELSGILQLLKYEANPNIPFPDGVYPLFNALRYGNNTSCDQKIRSLGYGLVMALLNHGAWVNIDTSSDYPDWTPLMFVIRHDSSEYQEEKVKKILERGAQIFTPRSTGGFSFYYKDYKDWTPLHAAAELGKTDIVKLLVNYGARNYRGYARIYLNEQFKDLLPVNVMDNVPFNIRMDIARLINS